MNNSVTDWLLEDSNPAIKYRTMTEIGGLSLAESRNAYEYVQRQKPVLRMFDKQGENGLWRKDWGVHTALRYLTAFAELGMQKDERLDRFVDYTVAELQAANRENDLVGCSSGLTLRALVMLGYHERADVMDLIKEFSKKQLFDGGFMCKMKLEKKPERKSCYKAAIAGVLLYSECQLNGFLPPNADALVNYFLKRDVFYSSDKATKFDEGRFGWRLVDNFFPVEPMRIGFVQTVAALSVLGAGNDIAMKEAWDLLNKRKDESGRLPLDGTLSKQPCTFGKVGAENKWVTFYATLAEQYRDMNN